jgi:exodeoxyribonuclease 7 large subunit
MRAKFDMIMENKSFKNPLLIVENKTLLLDKLEKEIIDLFKNIIQRKESKFNELVVGLDALSPLKTLLRGYSIVEKNDNVVKSVSDLNVGDNIKIILNDGNVNANII